MGQSWNGKSFQTLSNFKNVAGEFTIGRSATNYVSFAKFTRLSKNIFSLPRTIKQEFGICSSYP